MADRRDEEMAVLLDERAIERVLVRYARGIDRCDEELIASVYHEDSYDEHGTFHGTGAEFSKWVVGILKSVFEATSHRMSNATIEIDGSDAKVESYVIAYHKTRPGKARPSLVVVGGRYLDHFKKLDGEWKISRRIVVIDWSQSTPIEIEFPTDGYALGMRAPEDPSYEDFF